jgi:hypothetical protein
MPRTRLVLAALLFAASPAYAHFKMNTPANWTAQVTDGSPQKMPPCGNEGAPSDTGPVTEYKMGDTITIAIDETVPHPGHYRVSLAPDQASLPRDPDADVKPDSKSQCGSLEIDPTPTMPLIADGLLIKAAGRTGPQTMQVKLPDGMTCDHCVLQVVEFMSNHGAPCFYHHCANVKVSVGGPVGGGTPDAGTTAPGVDGGSDDGNGAGSTGGGCAIGGQDLAGATLLAVVLGFVVTRRRRRA